ncbi:MAG TPA: hypothetical protein VM577_04360 [Anaerovoracaceae bacterium]|nr:hypothetical protein [Anaerovoracaceae bacterium]
MQTAILIDRDEIRKVEAEEQYHFVLNVLVQMGLPLEECFPDSEDPQEFTPDYKRKLRDVLDKFRVLVLDDRDGGIKIYVEEELVAEWKKCRFELREDLSTVDPRKRIYVALYIDYWSMFEEQEG